MNLKLPDGVVAYVVFVPMHRRYRGTRVYRRTSDWLAYCCAGRFTAHGRTRRAALECLREMTGGVRHVPMSLDISRKTIVRLIASKGGLQ